MSDLEVKDLRTDYWGNIYPTAGDRARNTEKTIDKLYAMAYPKFESEVHNVAKVYEAFTFVHDVLGTSYVSTQNVPTGVQLSNSEYWVLWDVRSTDTQVIRQQLSDLLSVEDGTLIVTKPSASELSNLVSVSNGTLSLTI